MSWRKTASKVLGWAAWAGLGAVALQRGALTAHLSAPPARPRRRLGISILKPLCGTDPELAENLRQFAELPYRPYELLLGVESPADPAWPLARAMASRYPHVKAIVREGEPGLNPKVNQLITLRRYAQYPILLISDAGVRAGPGYLDEMSAMFENPQVGLATNVFTGRGHQTLGARVDNLHAVSNTGAHLVGKELGLAFVMGGSEALRADVLQQLGGFEAYKDVLAEDYLMGRDVERLGYRVATGRVPVMSVTPQRSLDSFYERFARWGTMQATATGSALPAVGLLLLNPIALAGLAAAVAPAGAATAAALGRLKTITAGKVALDMANAKTLGVEPLGLAEALAVPVKDAVLFGSWAKGLVTRTVDWRGKKFKVGAGTSLSRLDEKDAPDEQPGASGSRFRLARRP